jgi:aryl-alcohol dehydrogenase-like predicted oxidoreductase
VILGLGTVGIGRPWGYADAYVPDEASATRALETAVRAGYRFIDTAPSYGVSEERIGAFLRSSGAAELTIATKFGEHWDAQKQEPYTDHSYQALRTSLDRSMERLGRIDVLQLHKTEPNVLRSDAVHRAWEYARSLGVRRIGPSVRELESAGMAVEDGAYQVMQAPFSMEDERFGPVLREASERGIDVIVNRPFGMGRLLHEQAVTPRAALAFVIRQGWRGVILAGSKTPAHIEANMRAFEEASLLG